MDKQRDGKTGRFGGEQIFKLMDGQKKKLRERKTQTYELMDRLMDRH